MWERKQKGDDSLKLKPNQILYSYCIALFTHGHTFGNKQIVLYNVKTRNEFFFPLKKVCTDENLQTRVLLSFTTLHLNTPCLMKQLHISQQICYAIGNFCRAIYQPSFVVGCIVRLLVEQVSIHFCCCVVNNFTKKVFSIKKLSKLKKSPPPLPVKKKFVHYI